MKFLRGVFAFIAGTLLVIGTAQADVSINGLQAGGVRKILTAVPVTNTWQKFVWGGGAAPVAISENPFTFTCGPLGCSVRVVDAFVCGDQFGVADGVSPLGQTTTPNCTGASNIDLGDDTATANAAWTDAHFSKGTFVLGPGSHSLNLSAIALGGGAEGGGAFLKVTENLPLPVPTPALSAAGLALLAGLMGLAGFLVMRRRA